MLYFLLTFENGDDENAKKRAKDRNRSKSRIYLTCQRRCLELALSCEQRKTKTSIFFALSRLSWPFKSWIFFVVEIFFVYFC